MQCEQTKDIKVVNVSCSDADRHMPPSRKAIEEMKKSLQEVGQISPIGVYPVASKTYRVIVGATRFRAASELGWKTIRATIWIGSSLEYELHELIENEQRRELTPEQRREIRAKIKELQRQQLADVKPCKGGRGKQGGVSKAAREAGMTRRTAQRRQQQAKAAQNTESAHVSKATAAKSSDYAPYKYSLPWTIGSYKRIDAWCKRHNLVRAEGMRRIIRERLDSDEANTSPPVPLPDNKIMEPTS